jgi:hypothetical protein
MFATDRCNSGVRDVREGIAANLSANNSELRQKRACRTAAADFVQALEQTVTGRTHAFTLGNEKPGRS